MSGSVADLLVDTDVFVDHLRGAAKLVPGRHRLHYSVVTRAELFAGNTATNLSSQLLAPFRELAVDRAIAERAGRLARVRSETSWRAHRCDGARAWTRTRDEKSQALRLGPRSPTPQALTTPIGSSVPSADLGSWHMALFHLATIAPTKEELIAEWAPRQPWGPTDDVPMTVIGSYRFDDPDGKVGMETFLAQAGDEFFQIPLTYRSPRRWRGQTKH